MSPRLDLETLGFGCFGLRPFQFASDLSLQLLLQHSSRCFECLGLSVVHAVDTVRELVCSHQLSIVDERVTGLCVDRPNLLGGSCQYGWELVEH